jgi:hypothetical protein
VPWIYQLLVILLADHWMNHDDVTVGSSFKFNTIARARLKAPECGWLQQMIQDPLKLSHCQQVTSWAGCVHSHGKLETYSVYNCQVEQAKSLVI